MKKRQLKDIVCFIFTVLLLSINIPTFAASDMGTKVTLNKTSVILTVGRAYTLKATITPVNAKNKAVRWTSSNSKIAKVDATGKVIALKKGTVTITAITSYKGLKATCKINVNSSIDNKDITSQFKDKNFKSYIYKLIKKPSSKPILYGDVKNIKTLDIDFRVLYGVYSLDKLNSLSGIEYFTSLTTLDCSYNNLTTLDLSNNAALTKLDCYSNKLTTLDVSKNIRLTTLECSSNGLTTLDVSKNTSLTNLYCCWNSLTTLDLNKNIKLTNLDCSRNNLITLNVSKNTALTNLKCVHNNLTILDVSKNIRLINLDSSDNYLRDLNVSKNTKLDTLEWQSNSLTHLNTSKNTTVSAISDNIDITNKFTDKYFKIYVYALIEKASPEPILYSDVKGITALKMISRNINSLSGIEYFTSLTDLNCEHNNLTTLDVSKNIELTKLDCNSNKLTTLDVSKNTALTYLKCSYNNLTNLYTDNSLSLSWLDCEFNKLATLSISGNSTLSFLRCSYNKLTTLDVSKNTSLTKLSCDNNKLSTLDVSKNTVLSDLYCNNNVLPILDVSNNVDLNYLDCSYNQLTNLYSINDKWGSTSYRPQYTDSTRKSTTDSLVITIK